MEFLWQYRFREKSEGINGNFSSTLGTIYTKWLEEGWENSCFDFVQEAFENYIVDHHTDISSLSRSNRYRNNPSLAEKFPYLSRVETAELLRISYYTVKGLISKGILDSRPPLSYRDDFPLIRRDDVAALRRRWREALSLAATAAQLGVSKEIVLDVAKVGLIAIERGPDIDGSPWLFNLDSVKGCLDRIRAQIKGKIPIEGTAVDLVTAAKMVAVVGLNSAGVLKLMTEGQLSCYGDQDGNLKTLIFSGAEVQDCVKRIKAEKGWINLEEIAQRMGVKVTVASKWVSAGLISPVATYSGAQHFDQAEAEQFITTHIFSDEAARILGIGVIAVQKWTRQGRLHAIAGNDDDACHRYLFRREEVERLKPESRLTLPQLARQMGISRSQLWVNVKRGQITPISGPTVDGSKYYLFERRMEF